MTNPVTGAAFYSFYSVQAADGSSDLYAQVTATAVDRVDVYYRIYYHDMVLNQWLWLIDFPWERFWFGIPIRMATRPPLPPPDPAHEPLPPVRLIDQIKIETHDLTDDIPANISTVILNTPTSLDTYQEQANTFTYVCGGEVGDTRGAVNLFWKDLTKWVGGGKIVVTKFGYTSPTVKVVVFEQTFTSYPFTFKPEYSAPNFVQIPLLLFPPGGPQMLDDPQNPGTPLPDPNYPKYMVDGDTITVSLTVRSDDPARPPDITTIFSFRWYGTARFYQFADSATVGQPYSKQLEIIQNPWLPNIPVLGSFYEGSWSPSQPGAWNLSVGGLLTCTNPTAAGNYTLTVRLIGKGNSNVFEPILININITALPKIMAPPPTIALTYGLPFPEQYNLYATGHPTHYSYTGTLPVGISLDPATGIFSGTPTAEETPHNVTFSATNATGISPPYLTQWSVTVYAPPSINSASTLETFLEEITTYQITTDLAALSYRAFDLPAGLVLIGSVITGTPADVPGTYSCGIQAANRWGWGPVFPLLITVSIAPPVISSPAEITTAVDEPFSYQIAASHTPVSYGANNLPAGLMCNTATGLITGIPTTEGDYAIALSAINAGGPSPDFELLLHVVLPDIPVIDTTATAGRAITLRTHEQFTFQPTASHNPTSWTIDTVPEGCSFSDVTGQLSGSFQAGGLYGLAFTASNRGGSSIEAVFWFLVALAPAESGRINQLGTIIEIWIDLDTAAVTIGNELTQGHEIPQPPTGTEMSVKRGDSTELHVIFHENVTPAELNLQSLKFGLKAAYDDEYVVYSDIFRLIGAARFRIFPDFSGTNDDLDAILVDATTSLMGELQWEMIDDTGQTIRRSSQVFTVKILRDLIHPD